MLLLVACRQPNPEWQGAAEGDPTLDTAPSSTETGGGPGPMSQTSSPDADSTEGQDCNNDNMCPDGWVCGPMGCQQGADGDPCDGDGDCQDPAGICGPADACQTGEAGDPCSSNDHCGGGIMCTNDVCGGGSGTSGDSSSSGGGSSSSDSSSSGGGGSSSTGPA